MAVVLKVYPYLSPRLIEVLEPTTDVTVQELVNAIRAWEDSDIGQHYPSLIDAAGKEELGGGTVVGITATLQNAKLLFTGRTTPLDNGVGRTCDLTDSTGTTLYVNDADFVTDGIYEGCNVFNATTGELAAITEITDLNNIQCLPLSGQGGLGWTIGDEYKIFPNVQCNITGGNLVAVDDVGAELSPVFQTPNVQVVRSSSSSATLQELTSIQFSSFNGGVTIDIDNISGRAASGTAFPAGTPQQPVDNVSDLQIIKNLIGLEKVYVIGDLTLDSTEDWSRHVFEGESVIKSTIIVESSADVSNAEFSQCLLSGSLDGSSGVKDCFINNLNFIDGVISDSGFNPGTVVVGSTSVANVWDCKSNVPGPSTCNFDLNVTGILSVRNFAGGMLLSNYSGSSAHTLGLQSGQIIMSSSIVNGIFICRGEGKLVDEFGSHIFSGTWNGGVTIVNELLNTETIKDNSVWSTAEKDKVVTESDEVWKLHGLDITNPLTVNQTERLFANVTQSIATTGTGSLQETVITRT